MLTSSYFLVFFCTLACHILSGLVFSDRRILDSSSQIQESMSEGLAQHRTHQDVQSMYPTQQNCELIILVSSIFHKLLSRGIFISLFKFYDITPF